MKISPAPIPILTTAILILATVPATAAVLHVTPDGTGDYPTIAAAAAAAAPGDVVQLAAGVYTGDGNRDVLLDRELTVRGDPDTPDACIIDCQGSAATPHRAIFCDPVGSDNPTMTIVGLTIRGGWAPMDRPRGGAIFCGDGTHLLIEDCAFVDNHAEKGGALWTEAASWADVWRCTFTRNHAGVLGAAAAGDIVTTINLSWCLIHDNLAGGALGLHYGGIRVTSCTIVGNAGGACLGTDGGWGGYLLENTVVAYNGGPAFADNPDLHASLSCCDLYLNTAGNWNTAPVMGQLGQDGNIQAAPAFCNASGADYRLDEASPCAPFTPPNPQCDLIGAFGVGCGSVATMVQSWSAVKGRFE